MAHILIIIIRIYILLDVQYTIYYYYYLCAYNILYRPQTVSGFLVVSSGYISNRIPIGIVVAM